MKELIIAINLIINGFLIGNLYALASLGLTLLFGIMGVINVAHLDVMVLCSYVMYWLTVLYGFNPFIAFIITVPLAFVIGLAMEKILVEPLYARARGHKEFVRMTLPLFFGIAMVIRHSMTHFWTGDYRAITTWLTGKCIELGELKIPILRILCFVVSSIAVLSLYAFLWKTKTGKEIRALSQNINAAKLCGIKVERIRLISFAIGSATAGIAAYLFALIYIFYPAAAVEWVPLAFCIMVTGGLGCVEGTLLVGIIFGILDAFIGYIHSLALSRLIIFLVMLIVLLFRPAGILGRGITS
ncbi:MAG: hypothetical protein DRJ21_02270 [Candidatus Methanomethylicota archaeon]|uniref:Branched-chain amino acid ABC transporter permease n=1 Tax=Thermoproteota archaeon TaxID=2056631 RepID=A0A497EQK5_9CREN|nr:MAG: hypothetical protein DRJ21_02270 [Candidatus Verstraetearchaeota archaeon]